MDADMAKAEAKEATMTAKEKAKDVAGSASEQAGAIELSGRCPGPRRWSRSNPASPAEDGATRGPIDPPR
jgi:hypothetical protein